MSAIKNYYKSLPLTLATILVYNNGGSWLNCTQPNYRTGPHTIGQCNMHKFVGLPLGLLLMHISRSLLNILRKKSNDWKATSIVLEMRLAFRTL